MSEFAIQAGIYAAVNSIAEFSGMGVTVRDIGPRSTDGAGIYPFIKIGDIALAEMDTATSSGFDAAVRLHTHSNTGSMRQCKEIQALVYAALHKQSPAISGYNLINLYRENTDVREDSDGSIHGVCDYRALLEISQE